MGEVDERFVVDEKELEELYAWVDAVPLSRPKKNLARDFSDGVLVAEIIHYYFPRAVDMHNYFAASGIGQKKINWHTLNRKVFTKLGMRLNDSSIINVAEARPGAIEQILWDLRKMLKPSEGEDSTKADLAAYEKLTGSKSGFTGRSRSCSRSSSRTRHNGPSYAAHTEASYSKVERSPVYDPENDPDINNNSATVPMLGNHVPTQILYKGHKMVPIEMVDLKEREIKVLEAQNKTLSTKILRLENLLNLKDQRIEDMAHNLHNLKTMYERVTNSSWDR